jgi:hypothetical protein
MMPTRSEPMMVMMARPVGGLAVSLLVFGMADDFWLREGRRTYSHPGRLREPALPQKSQLFDLPGTALFAAISSADKSHAQSLAI